MTVAGPRSNDRELADILRRLDAVVAGARNIRGDTRERILEKAVEAFALEGFSATSVRTLSASVGITPAGLYSHFASKEEILGAALCRAYRNFLGYVLEVDLGDGRKPATAILRRHMEFQLRFQAASASTDQLLAMYYRADRYVDGSILSVIRDAQRLYFGRVQEAIGRQRDNDPDATPLETEATLALCNSVSAGPRIKAVNDPGELVDNYLGLIGRMLRLRERPRSSTWPLSVERGADGTLNPGKR